MPNQIRVQTQADIVFGTLTANVTVTHIRIRNSDSDDIIGQLVSTVAVQANERLRIASGDLDIVFPSGDVGNDFMEDIVRDYWAGTSMTIDLMTDNSTPISVGGYSQQTYSNWAISVET